MPIRSMREGKHKAATYCPNPTFEQIHPNTLITIPDLSNKSAYHLG